LPVLARSLACFITAALAVAELADVCFRPVSCDVTAASSLFSLSLPALRARAWSGRWRRWTEWREEKQEEEDDDDDEEGRRKENDVEEGEPPRNSPRGGREPGGRNGEERRRSRPTRLEGGHTYLILSAPQLGLDARQLLGLGDLLAKLIVLGLQGFQGGGVATAAASGVEHLLEKRILLGLLRQLCLQLRHQRLHVCHGGGGKAVVQKQLTSACAESRRRTGRPLSTNGCVLGGSNLLPPDSSTSRAPTAPSGQPTLATAAAFGNKSFGLGLQPTKEASLGVSAHAPEAAAQEGGRTRLD
jgi:hypothetical protein